MCAKRAGTKERILDASLELFNQHGERAMTTNHIAAYLGISPGNLYYHFRNKEEILERLMTAYGEELESRFAVPAGPVTLEVMSGYLDGVLAILWRYRFLYINLAELLQRDTALRDAYSATQTRFAGRVVAVLRALRAEGTLVVDDEGLAELAELLRMVVVSALNYQQVVSAGGPITESSVYWGVLRVLALLRPYFSAQAEADRARLVAHYQQRAAATALTPVTFVEHTT